MVNLPTLRYTRLQKNKWLACATLNNLHDLLDIDDRIIEYLSTHIKYEIFTVPKKNGTVRVIENPEDVLKQLQRKINAYLQAVYYFYKHPASYGFCIHVKKDIQPCNIYTHALQHVGCGYLINADLKDFFYSVTTQKITELFTDSPFLHDADSISWLCHISTYNGRLPMGSPLSPVLSNLAATKFDAAMHAMAQRYQYTYTRYVDDMSFSSQQPYSTELKDEILQIIQEYGFVANKEKLKEFGRDEIKIITGLQVGNKVSLGNAYWQKAEMLTNQLSALKCLMQSSPSATIFNRLQQISEVLNGYLAFAQMMGPGEKHKIDQIESRLNKMDEELEAFESLAWNEIPYQF